MELREVTNKLQRISRYIDSLTRSTGFYSEEDLTEVNYNKEDPEEAFKYRTIRHLLYRLEEVGLDAEELTYPIIAEGKLHKNTYGRYEVDGREITSGRAIELLTIDEEDEDRGHNNGSWKRTRMEHNGEDYYFYHYRNIKPEGQTVRLRDYR